MLAPFRYDADGSGRVPDTSPEALEKYRQTILALYPVADVEVTVREPYPWSQPIGANGDGWDALLWQIYTFRGMDGTPPEVYYYGIFNPTDTYEQYCQGYCILGLTWTNDSPPEVGSVDFRMAAGVGYLETAPDTSAHELGHSHGRLHAPCGPGLDPNSIDHGYPYPDGGIGVWGLDSVSVEIKDPTIPPGNFLVNAGPSDMMSYCANEWISDYNYAALLYRGKNVNLPDVHTSGQPMVRPASPVQVDHELIVVDRDGRGQWKPSVKRAAVGPAGSIPVSLTTVDGRSLTTRGHYYPYDHLPGGWLFFPTPAKPLRRAELTLQGRRISVARD